MQSVIGCSRENVDKEYEWTENCWNSMRRRSYCPVWAPDIMSRIQLQNPGSSSGQQPGVMCPTRALNPELLSTNKPHSHRPVQILSRWEWKSSAEWRPWYQSYLWLYDAGLKWSVCYSLHMFPTGLCNIQNWIEKTF